MRVYILFHEREEDDYGHVWDVCASREIAEAIRNKYPEHIKRFLTIESWAVLEKNRGL